MLLYAIFFVNGEKYIDKFISKYTIYFKNIYKFCNIQKGDYYV